MEVIGWGYDMDYVWCFWIADCHKFHRFLQKFLFLRNTVQNVYNDEWMPQFFLSLQHVWNRSKRTAYVSFAKITALNTLCRHSRFRPCARNVFNANTDWVQLLSTLSTCSFTVRVLVTVTPRIFTLLTRLIRYRSVQQVIEFNVFEDCPWFRVTSCGIIVGWWPLFNVMKLVLSSRYGTSWNDKVSIISILDESITVIVWYKVSCVYDIWGWPESRTLYNACSNLLKVRLFTFEVCTVRVASKKSTNQL